MGDIVEKHFYISIGNTIYGATQLNARQRNASVTDGKMYQTLHTVFFPLHIDLRACSFSVISRNSKFISQLMTLCVELDLDEMPEKGMHLLLL